MSCGGELRVRELSPRGGGAISVIELRGPGALERARTLAPALAVNARAPALVRLAIGGEALDEALGIVEGDEHVELHVHGSAPLVRRLLQLLGQSEPARTPSLEERAHDLLAHAPCEPAARILLDQAEGALRTACERIVAMDRERASTELAALAEAARVASFALEPRSVVLAGPVNAGKSTLFNALFGARRVVVSTVEGTTRDVVRERAMFGAWPVDLCDTAGEREPGGAVEREGQRLAREARARADLVVWLQPCDAPRAIELDPRTRVVHSRADLAPRELAHDAAPSLSAAVAPHCAAEVVHSVYRAAFDLPLEPWTAGAAVPFDAVSREAVARARESLLRGRDDWRSALASLLERA